MYAAISLMDNPSLSAAAAEAPVLNSGAEDVLQRHSGTHDDLNRLFVAMLRAAGISATMMSQAAIGGAAVSRPQTS